MIGSHHHDWCILLDHPPHYHRHHTVVADAGGIVPHSYQIRWRFNRELPSFAVSHKNFAMTELLSISRCHDGGWCVVYKLLRVTN